MQRLINVHCVWPWQHFAPQMCLIWEQSQQVRVYQEWKAMCHGCFPLGQVSRRLIHYTTVQYPTWTILYKSFCEMCFSEDAFVISQSHCQIECIPNKYNFRFKVGIKRRRHCWGCFHHQMFWHVTRTPYTRSHCFKDLIKGLVIF